MWSQVGKKNAKIREFLALEANYECSSAGLSFETCPFQPLCQRCKVKHSYQVGRWHQTGTSSWYVQAGQPCREIEGLAKSTEKKKCTPGSWDFFFFFSSKKPLVDAFYYKLFKIRQDILRKKKSLSTSFRKLPVPKMSSACVSAC